MRNVHSPVTRPPSPPRPSTVVAHHLGVARRLAAADAAYMNAGLLLGRQTLDPQRGIEGERRDPRRFKVRHTHNACVFFHDLPGFDPHQRQVPIDADRRFPSQVGPASCATPRSCGGPYCPREDGRNTSDRGMAVPSRLTNKYVTRIQYS